MVPHCCRVETQHRRFVAARTHWPTSNCSCGGCSSKIRRHGCHSAGVSAIATAAPSCPCSLVDQGQHCTAAHPRCAPAQRTPAAAWQRTSPWRSREIEAEVAAAARWVVVEARPAAVPSLAARVQLDAVTRRFAATRRPPCAPGGETRAPRRPHVQTVGGPRAGSTTVRPRRCGGACSGGRGGHTGTSTP